MQLNEACSGKLETFSSLCTFKENHYLHSLLQRLVNPTF